MIRLALAKDWLQLVVKQFLVAFISCLQLKMKAFWFPKLKVSENVEKTTIPGFKQVYRFFDQNNQAIADLITLFDEAIDENKPYTLFDPNYPYKRKEVVDF